jgi:hypothetical protein
MSALSEGRKIACYTREMMTHPASFTDLSDHDLLTAVQRLAGDERRVTAQFVASLAELDARRLYLGEGFSSLFTYCTQVLHLSEHAAYGRFEAHARRGGSPSFSSDLIPGRSRSAVHWPRSRCP